MKKLFIVQITLFILLSLYSNAQKSFHISSSDLVKIEQKYGTSARERVESWDSMIEAAKNQSILNQLQMVNDFFNKIPYKTDMAHWKKKDYWATPIEFMGTNGGDCEDYAIAKYFSLIKLGVPDSKLRITYVSYSKRNSNFEQAHMVLSYYHKAGAEPVILDNINKTLQVASKRTDLKPVYSFNASGLWQSQTVGETRAGENNLKSWKDLMSRF
ncbi:transglutaminase-like cysteine peptidase [Arcobacter vandammei]|uniref:transglutaminase-like cysteine peptidase n=1 Tax=Arcobacter vandammei TaxID=2782243 RepID=UPI0018DF2BCE